MKTSYEVIRATWLSRSARSGSTMVASFSTAALLTISFVYWTYQGELFDRLEASGELVFAKHEIWRLWTTLFIHADLGHVLSNAFLLFIFSYFVYGYFGSILFPSLALVVGGLTNAIALTTYEPHVQLIGASGVVYWLGGIWLALFALLSRHKSTTQRMLRVIGVGALLFLPTSETITPNISHRTHFIGFILGILSALPYYAFNRKRFLTAEVRELIIEESPDDDFPSRESFQTDPSSLRHAIEFRDSRIIDMIAIEDAVSLQLEAIVHSSSGLPGRDPGLIMTQNVKIDLFAVTNADRLKIDPGIIIDGELKIETTTMSEFAPIPFSYRGACQLILQQEETAEALFIDARRGVKISILKPGKLRGRFTFGHA